MHAERKAEKIKLRKEMLQKRSALSPIARTAASEAIVERIIQSEAFAHAQVVFAFLPFREEVAIEALITACWQHGKHVYVPKIDTIQKTMHFYELRSWDALAIGHYGIREPDATCPKYEGAPPIDIVLMPGVAFDRELGRLGYGAGYYDRFLQQLHHQPMLIAPAYSAQIVDRVPTDAWDISIDAIVTEDAWIGEKRFMQ